MKGTDAEQSDLNKTTARYSLKDVKQSDLNKTTARYSLQAADAFTIL